MDLTEAIKILNSSLKKQQPKKFSGTWVYRHAPKAYRYIWKNVRTELGDIDWDTVTRKLDRDFQERWLNRRTKKVKPYRNGNYIKEDQLVKELLRIIDEVDLDKLGIKQQIEQKLESYNKFRSLVLGQSDQDQLKQKNMDLKNYTKYILTDGSMLEKRELMACLKSKLILKDKQITVSL